MLAALRDPACVVAIAAPTDLTTVQGAQALSMMVQNAFGYDAGFLAANSPALLVHEDGDDIVPITQSQEFASSYPYTTLVNVPFGKEAPFGHATTTAAAAAEFKARMRAFVDRALAPAPPPSPSPAQPVAPPRPTPASTGPKRTKRAKQAKRDRCAKRSARRKPRGTSSRTDKVRA